MTTLYLHGLNSTNQNSRTDWLKQFGKVVNPLLTYRNIPETYQYLEKLIQKFLPDIIVGSSMGGYFGFHLGNYYRIPTLLLNPALVMTLLVRPDNRLLATDTIHHISMGKHDKIIKPDISIQLLKDWQVSYKIYTYDTDHETPFEIFVDAAGKSGLFRKK